MSTVISKHQSPPASVITGSCLSNWSKMTFCSSAKLDSSLLRHSLVTSMSELRVQIFLNKEKGCTSKYCNVCEKQLSDPLSTAFRPLLSRRHSATVLKRLSTNYSLAFPAIQAMSTLHHEDAIDLRISAHSNIGEHTLEFIPDKQPHKQLPLTGTVASQNQLQHHLSRNRQILKT